MSDLLNELKAKRGKLADSMSDMTKNIDSDNWTDDNNVQFDKVSLEFDELDSRISRLQKAENAKNQADRFEKVSKGPVDNGTNQVVSKYGNEEYETNFKNWVQSKGKINNALEVGTDSEGGYIVAESWEKELNKLLFDESIMRQVCTVRGYETDTNIPLTASVGGIAWIAEEGTYPTNSSAFDNKKVASHKAGNIELVSEELLKDSFINLRTDLGEMYAESFGAGEELAFTTGDGSGKPTGFTVDADNGKTSASETAIIYDEVIDLLSSVKEKYARNGIFMCNRLTAAALRKLKDTNGMPLWAPAMTAGLPSTLFGAPMRINEAMPDIAESATPLAFGNFKYYRIADRQRLLMQMLVELYAGSGQVGFKFMKRMDGLLIRTDAIKLLTMKAA